MSQDGAGRWARGNQCSTSGAGDQPWSVRWDDFRQILVHYYTGVHLLDANNNNIALTPDNRWNLLWIQSLPPSLATSSSYDISLKFQNTSTWDWAPPNPGVLGYQWTARGAQPTPNGWTTTPVVVSMLKGTAYQATVQVTTPPTHGDYDLHWDVARQEGSNSYTWFSASWPHPVLPIKVGVGSSVSSSSDDAGPNAAVYNSCLNNFSTSYNEVYFGHCQDGTNVISGFRFDHIQVPPRATIVEAHLEFTVDGPYSNAVAVTLYGEQSINSATFSANKPPANRTTFTNSSVSWNIPTTDEWVWEQYRFSPDLTPIVQDIVNQNRWKSGNPITIIVKPADTGTTHRRVIAWDRNSTQAARLVITYQ